MRKFENLFEIPSWRYNHLKIITENNKDRNAKVMRSFTR